MQQTSACVRAGGLRRGAVLIAVAALLNGALPAAACVGDCNGDAAVGVGELVVSVAISLGHSALAACPAVDRNGDRRVSVDELVVAVGSALDGCVPQTRAFVVTSNFQAGSFATVELDAPRAVTPSSSQRRLHRDAVVRTRGGLLYVLNRLSADNLQVLDPADGFRTRLQCSTGNGSNPHDIAFAGDDKAYISLYEESELLIVNPAAGADCEDFVRGSIDLTAVADADGTPDMDQMAVVGDRLYVAVQRLDVRSALRLPADNGAIAVIDTATDALIDTIELSGENPFSATKGLTVRNGVLYVAQAGLFGELDGGIERVDLARASGEGFFVTEADLGGDITDFVLVSNRLAYAVVSQVEFTTALVAFDPSSGSLIKPIASTEGYNFFDLELDDRGELYLADRTRQRDGIRVFRASDGMPLVDQPIDLGLSPFEIVFIR